MKTNELLNTLPIEVQTQITNTLKAYDEVNVFYENGKYNFGVVLKSKYAPDHKFIGTFYAKDIYTESERIENYINEFKSYPINYKGKRDYKLLKDMEDREIDYENSTITSLIGKINDNGDFEIVGKETHKF